jgi:predicted SnoaL-like aldol condensation-catalyzing enzyme
MTAENNKALVRRFVEEAQCRHNLAAVDEYLSPEFVDHSVPPGLPPTREGVKLQFGMFLAALPDLQAIIHDQVADADKVVTRKTLRGTHQGDLLGIPPTGKTVNIEVIDILRVQNGVITDHWNLVDTLSLLRQLDALPG